MLTGGGFIYVFPVAALFTLCGLLFAEKKESRLLRYIFKPVTSMLFVLMALTGALSGAYSLWITCGLVLSFIGDVALMFKSERAFMAGLVSFLLAHIFYIVAFLSLVPIFTWNVPALVVVFIASLVVLRWFWPKLGDMRVPVIFYVLVISCMVWRAWTVFFYGDIEMSYKYLIAFGATFFFLSDIAVAKDQFIGASFANRLWGLPLYYIAQFLLAFSVLGIIN